MSRQLMPFLTAGSVLVTVLTAAPALAFHDGGVASCGGCHTMHTSQDGTPVDPDAPGGSPGLLVEGTSTDVCLSCHALDYGAVLGPDPLSPPPEHGGGNFAFLLEDNINDGPNGASAPIMGNHAGHNVATITAGIPADPDHIVAPGGSYPAGNLTCTSCHDPHGNQSFRMLRGVGADVTGFMFTNPAPQAEGVSVLAGQESPTSHTAYHQGWTDWCANCHGEYHRDNDDLFPHPVDRALGGDISREYNEYNGPSDPNGGSAATAYLPEVPFEDPAMTVSSTFGANSSSRIMCMTCHRAHATSAPKSNRWDGNVAFLGEDGVRSGSFPIPNPYGDVNQQALCMKCHYDEASTHSLGRACLECHRTHQ